MATINVTSTADSGAGTLRQAIIDLNAQAGSHTITFTGLSGTITRASVLPTLNRSMTITGPGLSNLTISGNNLYRVFVLSSGTLTFNISGLTIANGRAAGTYPASTGGGVFNPFSGSAPTLNIDSCYFTGCYAGYGGSAIFSQGPLTVTNTSFVSNTGVSTGSVVSSFGGTATIGNCTFSGNAVTPYSNNANSSCTVYNCTFSGNTGGCGGIAFETSASVTVLSSTISGNTGTFGGGFYLGAYTSLTLKNTIISGNTGGVGVKDFNSYQEGKPITSAATNIIGTISTSSATSAARVIGDPLLGALQNNGGTTQTMAVGAGSVAINAGTAAATNAAPVNALDQRGTARSATTPTIGAVEYVATTTTTTTTTAAPTTTTTTTAAPTTTTTTTTTLPPDKIRIKRSSSSSAVPATLLLGEIAANIADQKVWIGNTSQVPIVLSDYQNTFVYQGDWDLAVNYKKNDVVKRNGSFYMTIRSVANNGVDPATDNGTGGWQIFSNTVGNQGFQGSQGLQGLQGNQGAAGTNGSQGNQGFQGIVGTTGNQGSQGSQGNQGVVGTTGSQGSQGFQGVVGITGSQGSQGYQGVVGTTGSQGLQGSQGTVGTTGSQGSQGTAGTNGSQGFQGVTGTGNQGSQGNQGNQGLTGTGSQGFQGDQGYQGHQGDQGWQGEQGDQGHQGWQGHQGDQGWQGDQGYQGSQGDQGFQGATGTGSQGDQGSVGSQGDQGYQGSQGDQGQGNQGDQGSVGSQGDQGLTGPVAGSANQVVYKDGSNAAAGSSSFTFDGTTVKVLDGIAVLIKGTSPQPTNIFTIQNIAGTNLLHVDTNYALYLARSLNLTPFNTSAGNTSEIRFYELAANGTNYVGFKAGDIVASNVIWTLPTTDGTSGQVLSTNASGVLSWVTATSKSAGSDIFLANNFGGL